MKSRKYTKKGLVFLNILGGLPHVFLQIFRITAVADDRITTASDVRITADSDY